MGKITALKEGKGRNKRISVFVDGRFAFSLEGDVVVAGALRVGQELTASEAEKLAAKDQHQRGMNAAVRLLGYRPRSEAELRERLLRRGF
jgi:regulatory protein